MRYLFVFLGKCFMIIMWLMVYLAYVFTNIIIYLWYFNKSKLFDWYRYTDGVATTPIATFYDYLNTYTYN